MDILIEVVWIEELQTIAVLASNRIFAHLMAMVEFREREKEDCMLSRWTPRIIFLFAAMQLCVAGAQNPPAVGFSQATADRLKEPGWWPTKGDSPRSQYSGSAGCAGCHKKIALLQQSTPMYAASVPAAQSDLLANRLPLQFHEGAFSTSVTAGPQAVDFSTTDGVNTTLLPAVWAFGSKNGQTYILEKNGVYFESRLSFFAKTEALDITPGQSPEAPNDLETALGRKMDIERARSCFGCHTTAAVTSKVFEPEKASAGVTCEVCHGPGAAHVASMTSNDPEQATAILNPAHLSPIDSVDFCGACHSTWADAMEARGAPGPGMIRFQPYRLEQSRCWGSKGDARITCIACHDPHQPLVQEPAAYDSKCLACHAVRSGSRKPTAAKTVCKAAVSNCVSCHMPKYELPQTHTVFTDHAIGVVRGNALQPGNLTR